MWGISFLRWVLVLNSLLNALPNLFRLLMRNGRWGGCCMTWKGDLMSTLGSTIWWCRSQLFNLCQICSWQGFSRDGGAYLMGSKLHVAKYLTCSSLLFQPDIKEHQNTWLPSTLDMCCWDGVKFSGCMNEGQNKYGMVELYTGYIHSIGRCQTRVSPIKFTDDSISNRITLSMSNIPSDPDWSALEAFPWVIKVWNSGDFPHSKCEWHLVTVRELWWRFFVMALEVIRDEPRLSKRCQWWE